MQNNIPDLTKLTWPLNVALVGAVFSIFALIYNVHFIYYGFITFLYGVINHMVDAIGSFGLSDKKWKNAFILSLQVLFTIIWICILMKIY